MPTAALLLADPARASRRLHHQDSAGSTATYPDDLTVLPPLVTWLQKRGLLPRGHTLSQPTANRRAHTVLRRSEAAPSSSHEDFRDEDRCQEQPLAPSPSPWPVAEPATPHQTPCPLDKPLSASPAGPSLSLHPRCHTPLCVSEPDVDLRLSPRQLPRPLGHHWVCVARDWVEDVHLGPVYQGV